MHEITVVGELSKGAPGFKKKTRGRFFFSLEFGGTN